MNSQASTVRGHTISSRSAGVIARTGSGGSASPGRTTRTGTALLSTRMAHSTVPVRGFG
jgi:hypothetical protein